MKYHLKETKMFSFVLSIKSSVQVFCDLLLSKLLFKVLANEMPVDLNNSARIFAG